MARIKSRLCFKIKPNKKNLLKPEKYNNHDRNLIICFVM